MFLWCLRITRTAVYFYCVGLALAIQKNVKPLEGVTLGEGSLGREADCKGKANVTCDNIW